MLSRRRVTTAGARATPDTERQTPNVDVAAITSIYCGLPHEVPELVRGVRYEMVGEIVVRAYGLSELSKRGEVMIISADQRLTLALRENRTGYRAIQQQL